MLRAYRTICTTDSKGRPIHRLDLISVCPAEMTNEDQQRQFLAEQINHKIRAKMANDIANDEKDARAQSGADPMDANYIAHRAQAIKRRVDLEEQWEIKDKRWRMQNGATPLNEFVYYGEDYLTTIVYHILDY